MTHNWTAEAITNMMHRNYIKLSVSTIASLALRHRHHLHKHGLLLNRERRRRCLVQIAALILECCEAHHQLSNKRTRKREKSSRNALCNPLPKVIYGLTPSSRLKNPSSSSISDSSDVSGPPSPVSACSDFCLRRAPWKRPTDCKRLDVN